MTIAQKILAFGRTTENANVSSLSEDLCAVCGFLPEKTAAVLPDDTPGVFLDLTGVLRDDVTSDEVAAFLYQTLKNQLLAGKSLEIGGDSLSYLTMDDRLAVAEKLRGLAACVLFECDYLTVMYVEEHDSQPLCALYNDGPNSYEQVLKVDVTKA